MASVTLEARLGQMGRGLREELAAGREVGGDFFRRAGKVFVERLLAAEVGVVA